MDKHIHHRSEHQPSSKLVHPRLVLHSQANMPKESTAVFPQLKDLPNTANPFETQP
jgi:hypothetical protein